MPDYHRRLNRPGSRIGLWLLAILMVVVLASCGGGSGDPVSPTTPTQTPSVTREPAATVTIEWSFWGDPWEVEVNQRVVSVFEADYPGIHVKTRHQPWESYFNQADQWLESESPPDVMFLDFVPLYAARGVLENLDPYVRRDALDVADFYPGLLQYNTYRGSLYGLSRDNDTKVIYYNKALFDEAGLAYPREGWTWEELRQAAIRLTKTSGGRTDQYGFAYEPDEWWRLWVWQNGAEVYDNDFAPARLVLGSPEAVAALQWLADLTNVDRVTPPYAVQKTSLSIGQLFQESKLAMAFGNHALLPAFASSPQLRWDVAGLPQNKARVNVAGGSAYVISSRSRHKEAAWTFLKWLSSPKGQAIFTETGVVVPARRTVGKADIFLKQRPPHQAAVFLSETELGRSNPMFKGVQDISDRLNQALVPVWEGRESARDAVQRIGPEINRLLTQYRQP